MATLRGLQQPELSKRLFKIIKNENVVISAYETAGRERVSIASQLSEWGESTGDEAISDISDKLGVLLAEIGEQEDIFAQNLEDYRGALKQIRNTESSVQPSREHRMKIAEEIQKLKHRDPTSAKLVTLEQELVRAEAQNLVAEAQLTNVTRQKLKEAFDLHLAATIERAEKQIILARHARRLLRLLDDTPVVPGDQKQPYDKANEARQILDDAESDLRAWESTAAGTPTTTAAGERGPNLMPRSGNELLETADQNITIPASEDATDLAAGEGEAAPSEPKENTRRIHLTDENAEAKPQESSENNSPVSERTT
ncbi:hypothetical protein VTN77DRAFT_3637 [Rasamsonia byssochlamydoides]|uniref:uncharacterized protein n=1 Tax=Rasamsonia byssochlamydoides TaxID=89139 RepID=UPI0037449166